MRFALGHGQSRDRARAGRSDGATKVLIHRAIRQLEEIVARARPASGAVRSGAWRELEGSGRMS